MKMRLVWSPSWRRSELLAEVTGISSPFKLQIILRLWVCLIFKVKNVIFALSKGYNLKREPPPLLINDRLLHLMFQWWHFKLSIFYMHTYEKNEDIHSCGKNCIAEKKGRAGYHFNRTVRVQWFFLVIFIWGFYVCASWFKGTLNHWGWGVVDYAFNQGVGLGRVAGRVTGASMRAWLYHAAPFSLFLAVMARFYFICKEEKWRGMCFHWSLQLCECYVFNV